MRAIRIDQFGAIEYALIGEMPEPLAGAGEVLVEVRATAVNYVDLLLIAGKHQSRPALPYVPGKGPAGVVIGVGQGVTSFKPGDRVLAMCEPGGGYAERLALPATQCHPIPDSMSFVDAASMALVYDTAWFAIRERGRYQPGETVLVLGGSGGVGLAAIQLGKALGAKVLAGVANPAKFDLARDAGADGIIDLGRADLQESLRAQVHAQTDGNGADIIVDPLGDAIFDAAVRALAWCGRMVVIGFAAGRIPTLKVNYLLVRNVEVSGLQIGDYRKRAPEKTAACFVELCGLFQTGKIRALPTTTMPLERVQDGLRAVRDRTVRGRIVLTQGAAKD